MNLGVFGQDAIRAGTKRPVDHAYEEVELRPYSVFSLRGRVHNIAAHTGFHPWATSVAIVWALGALIAFGYATWLGWLSVSMIDGERSVDDA